MKKEIRSTVLIMMGLTLGLNGASLAYTPVGGSTTVCYGLTCGSTVQALQDFSVVGLATFAGNFFSPTNTPDAVVVGLWDDSGNLLASANITTQSTLVDGIWYSSSITPVSLVSGRTYVLGTFVPASNTGGYAAGNAFWQDGSGGLSEYLLPLSGLASSGYQLGFFSVFGTEIELSFPTEGVLGTYASANLLVEADTSNQVPEPSSWIAGFGLVSFVLLKRNFSRRS